MVTMNNIPRGNKPTAIAREYTNLAGVDFSSDISKVALNRSPYSVNMYRDYLSEQGKAIETRPGFRKLAKLNGAINGIHFFTNTIGNVTRRKVLVHAGKKLYEWINFYHEFGENGFVELYSDMNYERSISFAYNDSLFILDGKNYLEYVQVDANNFTLRNANVDSFIPTTTISRNPSGGGTVYQQVNVLQPKRKNSFLADGTSTDYVLDTDNLDAKSIFAVQASVNGVELVEDTDFTVDRTNGVVTFNTAPAVPATVGSDNVEITFSKTIEGYNTRIAKCRIACIFDNKVFFSGNPDYPNGLFHSMLNDPKYIGDLNYYQDGSDNTAIMSIIHLGERLAVIKESNNQDASVFYHSRASSDELGVYYPTIEGISSTGCVAVNGGINLRDDPLFITDMGLDAISKMDLISERSIQHRSTLVDAKLTNETDLEQCQLCEWNGYLLILINGKIYLADSRQKYSSFSSFEYEWYYWDNIGVYEDDVFSKANMIKEYDGLLLFGTEDGHICIFNTDLIKYPGELYARAYSDDDRVINCCWTTVMDNFGYGNRYKITNKRGGVAKLKSMSHSICKLKEKTNKSFYKEITRHNGGYFDFNDIDFADFTFNTFESNNMIYRIKEKKWIEISLVFYSDELQKPFGIYGAILEAFVGGYVKR